MPKPSAMATNPPTAALPFQSALFMIVSKSCGRHHLLRWALRALRQHSHFVDRSCAHHVERLPVRPAKRDVLRMTDAVDLGAPLDGNDAQELAPRTEHFHAGVGRHVHASLAV